MFNLGQLLVQLLQILACLSASIFDDSDLGLHFLMLVYLPVYRLFPLMDNRLEVTDCLQFVAQNFLLFLHVLPCHVV